MDKEEVRAAYKAAIEDGYRHVIVSKATGIGVSSLKNFHNDEGGFGPDSVERLRAWLEPRGFLNAAWARRDPFEGICIALRSLADELEAEPSFDARRIRLENFATTLLAHPAVVGFKNSGEAGKE